MLSIVEPQSHASISLNKQFLHEVFAVKADFVD